jgi:hypothetical protein
MHMRVAIILLKLAFPLLLCGSSWPQLGNLIVTLCPRRTAAVLKAKDCPTPNR